MSGGPRSTAVGALALVLAAAGPAPAQIHIAFGDSLVEGFGDSRGIGYPGRLESRLNAALGDGSVVVVNFGSASETTIAGLSRIDGAIAFGGNILHLLEGTNDIPLVLEGEISLETTIFNLDAMANKAENAGMEAVHATVIPRIPGALEDQKNLVTIGLVFRVRELAHRAKRRLVDLWQAFDPDLDPTVFRTLYSEEDRILGHPNDAGYDVIANAFRDVFLEVDSVPPVLGSFDPGPLPEEIPPATTFRVPLYEPFGAAGIDVGETRLTVNGEVVDARSDGGKRRVELTFTDADAVGCRVRLGVQSQDLAEPPNTLDRVIADYRIEGRGRLPGDVDFDCRVDGFDLVAFALAFGAEAGDDRYAIGLDFNGDGTIDGEDLAILAGNFGRSSG